MQSQRFGERVVSIPAMAWLVVLTIGVMPTLGQPGGEAQKPAVKTLVYDVRELLRPVPNYPVAAVNARVDVALIGGDADPVSAPATLRLVRPGETTRPAVEGDERVVAVIQLIQETIEPDSWKDNGGEFGAVKELNGMLVITHTEDVHRQVGELLSQLRGRQTRMVRIVARWLALSPADLAALPVVKGDGPMRELDPAALQKMSSGAVRARAETVCFSGQTVFVRSGRRQSYVEDVNPIVGQQAVGLDPTVEVATSGATLEVTPLLQPDGSSAIVDVHSELSDVRGIAAVDMFAMAATSGGANTDAAAVAPPATPLQLERPNVLAQQLKTTMRVALGRPTIVGGMTLEPSGKTGESPLLLLVLEVFGE